MGRFRSIFRGLLIALLVTTAMGLIGRFLVLQYLGQDAPFMALILAVMAAAWVNGLGPGLLATVFGAALGTYWSLEGTNFESIAPYLPGRLVAFVIIGVLISWGMETMHAARRLLEERQRELQHQVIDRQKAEAAERDQRKQLAAEMQRRAAAEMALREREERIRLAVESANIGTFDFNPVTGERAWSARAKKMFGLALDADVNNVSFLERVHPDDRERASQAVQQALHPSGDGKYDIDCRIIWPDETIHWFIAKGQVLFEGEPPHRHPIRFLGTILEITDRKLADEALRDSESRLYSILNNTPAVVYLKDTRGRYLMVNRRFEELFQITREQIVGKTDTEVFPADVVTDLQANDRRVRETGQPLEFEEVVPHDGIERTYLSVKFPIFDAAGQCSAVGGISTDISDRKQAADELEAEQELLRHTIQVQDQERHQVTYGIHDSVVQYATGALMQLEGIRKRLSDEEIGRQLDRVAGILRKTVSEARRIINGIRTPVLDDCGVVAALAQLIEDEARANVHVEFVKDETLGRLTPNIELALYHITQEALTNFHKHSSSDKVRVELARRGDRVHLEIRDWGKGFSPASGPKGVHGLRGMSERARIAGGRCDIVTAPGKGTQIIVDLPYQAKA